MKTILSLFLLCSACTASSENYYFSTATGDDSRTAEQAKSPATPWKSIDKLNAVFNNLKPGDSVLFNRGDVFQGSLHVSKSGIYNLPIVLSAYGAGRKPVFTGLTLLSDWEFVGKGVSKSACASCQPDVNMVVINDVAQAIGRFPNQSDSNKGFLTISSHTGHTQISGNQLPANPDWTGGEVVIRKTRWIIDRNLITQHAGKTISYHSSSNYDATDRFGYFIQNHLNTLDQPGEWFFDANAKKLHVYAGAGYPLVDVKASVISTLIYVHNQANIVFNNLSFQGANTNAFDISNAQHVEVKNCDILFSGTNAVSASNTDHFKIANSLIRHTNNNAIQLTNCSYSSIENNQIKNTGLIAGMGKSGDGTCQAILIMGGNNNVVAYNKIDSTGYVPITFGGNAIVINNNFINYFAITKDDGGGIYTWNNYPNPETNYGRKVTNNIILNGVGAGEGTDNPAYLPANGIYIDDNAGSVEIVSNTIANCNKYGIFIHNAHEINIEKNTLFNNGAQLYMSSDNYAPKSPVRNNSIKNNIFFARATSQLTASFESNDNDITKFGVFDNNYYCRPVDDLLTLHTSYSSKGKNVSQFYSLRSWQSAYGQDLSSQKSPVKIPLYNLKSLLGNNQYSNGTFDADIGGLYGYSAAGNCTTSWNSGGKLDGGALQVSFNRLTGTTDRSYIIIGIGAVTVDKNYILKFSSMGSPQNKIAGVFLRKSQSPYNDLTDRKTFLLNHSRQINEFLFSSPVADKDASIVFEIGEQASPFWLDNIQLHQAAVTMTQPDDYIRFEYNAGSTSKTVSLDKPYVDVKNNKYKDNVQIKPYASIILLKQPLKTKLVHNNQVISKEFVKK